MRAILISLLFACLSFLSIGQNNKSMLHVSLGGGFRNYDAQLMHHFIIDVSPNYRESFKPIQRAYNTGIIFQKSRFNAFAQVAWGSQKYEDQYKIAYFKFREYTLSAALNIINSDKFSVGPLAGAGFYVLTLQNQTKSQDPVLYPLNYSAHDIFLISGKTLFIAYGFRTSFLKHALDFKQVDIEMSCSGGLHSVPGQVHWYSLDKRPIKTDLDMFGLGLGGFFGQLNLNIKLL